MKKCLLLAGVGFCCVSGAAYAAFSCRALPSCKDLGYSRNVAECGDRPVLHCPFDLTNDSAVFCLGCSKTKFKYSQSDAVSTESGSCTDIDGKVYYDTLCSGTKEGNCSSGLVLLPNCLDIHGVQWGSCACTYQYDAKNYPNAKGLSCVRNGVRYYSDLCGGVSKRDANCKDGEVFVHNCYSYNGVSYGSCGAGKTINVTGVARSYTSNHDVMSIDTVTFGYTLSSSSGDKIASGGVTAPLNGSKTQQLATGLEASSYKLTLGQPEPFPWHNSSMMPCYVLAVTFNGICYTNNDPNSLYMPTTCKSSHQPLDTTITLQVKANGDNNLQIVGNCTGW